ncbi:FAD-binding oxidoreductase [Isoptericola variabilis]|uniref:FAD linked oxidase domain protein n=1 Tax=Isoptericola variabilis (strain 225) TaxID=743718 RepID=F6FWH7_ISOV2|nr:FAD-binding oxidoreductase [Isoptericola variabilis]AEG44551.1 FAD linked oxidase domain protein [Isoptericola variabilis 225]TWH26532.1 FAD/FMN-containing dehydrogenase [Isoptericola variabilis J7]
MTTTSEAADPLARRLAPALDGELLLPGDPAFDAALPGYNLAVRHTPVAVVMAASADDVARTVRTVRATGLRVAVRATGHGAAAAGPDTVLLDTSRLQELRLDPRARTVRVGAGVRWRQVLDAAAPYGLAGLCGSSPDVGVVGYTLGGGTGPVARTFGFTADHVESVELVTPDGRAVVAAPDENPELFWAVRGGGAAFGVVTALTLGLVDLPALRAGALWFDAAHAAEVLHAWRRWVADLPESVTTSVARLELPPDPALPPVLSGRSVVALRFAHVGPGPEADALLGELREAMPAPLVDTVGDLPYARIGEVHSDPPHPMPMVDRGLTLAELPAAAVEAFCAATPPGSPVMLAEIRLLGGAMRRAPLVPSAIAGRDAAFSFFVATPAAPAGPPGAAAAVGAVLDALAPWSTGGALVNLAGARDEASSTALRRAWGDDTYARLVALRRAYDPDGVLAPSARWDVVA